MDFEGLHHFTIGMIDKAGILKKDSAQPNVAIFARFAPYGREQAQWFVKQALDIGLMGVIFNGIDNPDQALLAVRNMRYPQRKTSGNSPLVVGDSDANTSGGRTYGHQSRWRPVGHHDD